MNAPNGLVHELAAAKLAKATSKPPFVCQLAPEGPATPR
jgi:hypothetical protein